MVKFNNKVIIITGGASTMGIEIAKLLIPQNAKVHLFDLNYAELVNFSEKQQSDNVFIKKLDGTNSNEVQDAIQEVIDQHGRIDYLFNFIGIGLIGETYDMTVELWEKMLDVNIKGVLFPVIQAYKIMVKQKHGHIVNMSSLGGMIPVSFNTAYGTTKHAINGLSLSLREEAKEFGVKVSVICCGGIRTKMWDNLTLLNLHSDKFIGLVPPEKLYPADKAAVKILKAVSKNKAKIIFPAFASIAIFLYKNMSGLFYAGMKKSNKNLRSIKKI